MMKPVREIDDEVRQGRTEDEVSQGGIDDEAGQGGIDDEVSQGGIDDEASQGGIDDEVRKVHTEEKCTLKRQCNWTARQTGLQSQHRRENPKHSSRAKSCLQPEHRAFSPCSGV
jgi:hypothetical protein